MDENDWQGQIVFNINGARALYDHLEYAIQTWPGSPARPAEEQEMLKHLKNQMFAMKMDYNLKNLD